MPRIDLVQSFRLLMSEACIRTSDLPDHWHFFTQKWTFLLRLPGECVENSTYFFDSIIHIHIYELYEKYKILSK